MSCAGAVYIYDGASSFSFKQKLTMTTNGGEGTYIYFGNSVAFSGDGEYLVVGATMSNSYMGGVYIYKRYEGYFQPSKMLFDYTYHTYDGYSESLGVSADGTTGR